MEQVGNLNIPCKEKVKIIGAGLAGAEASLVLANLGFEVDLYEMKPDKKTSAHRMNYPAELVCSNSFRSNRLENAVGLLKEELRQLNSPLMHLAEENSTPAGGALAVDRELFGKAVLQALCEHPLIHYHENSCIEILNENDWLIVATGPLTDGALFSYIKEKLGVESLHFFDAAAPILDKESLDMNIVFKQSRYDRGEAAYLNCPMNKEEYLAFYQALKDAEVVEMNTTDKFVVFEGCMPIEVMAQRGVDTMRFGPLKPVGLVDPRTGKQPYACVQLRQDDRRDSMYNLVGFQTRLKFSEQKRIFSMIPGLKNLEILRYGVMHRNSYLQSPGCLNAFYQCLAYPSWFFAGQMTGVEGYVESLASGHWAARHLALTILKDKVLKNKGDKAELNIFYPEGSIIASMSAYVADEKIKKFQPMNANFGLLPAQEMKVKRSEKHSYWIRRSLEQIERFKQEYIKCFEALLMILEE